MRKHERCLWCQETIVGTKRKKFCSNRCRTNYHQSENPSKNRPPPKRMKGAVTSSRRRGSLADQNASGLHVGSGGRLVNRGGSQFYNPAHTIAREIQEALSEPAAVTSLGEIVFDKGPAPEQRKPDEDKMVILSYRIVKRRSDKGVMVAMKGRTVWLPKSLIEFLPGNLVKMPVSIAISRGLYWEKRPGTI